jgi:cell wall-associated NlpC family hydrolase
MMGKKNDNKVLDPRVYPYRKDIAADFLEGHVKTKNFVSGKEKRLGVAWAPVMCNPCTSNTGASDILQASELLFGEAFSVFEDKNGWSWGQCKHDGYVGYVKSSNLFKTLNEPTHWVSAISTLVFPDSKGEYPPLMRLSIMAGVMVDLVEGEFSRLASGGWIFSRHIKPVGEIQPDFIATASMLNREPYLWGGRGGQGIDCSGLIQISLAAAGVVVPRDTDQQADCLGQDIIFSKNLFELKPNDIVFFPGHVGIYLGSGALLHASSHEMMVVTQSLEVIVERMEERHSQGVTRVRRQVKS